MQSSHVSLVNYVLQRSQPGNVQHVIDTIDRFGWTQQWLMNIGDRKGQILDDAIRTRRPKTVLELGTFLGYSSLRMASQLPDDAFIISIERNRQSAEIAHTIHKHAGVEKRIQLIVGSTESVIPRLSEKYHINAFDFIFIDHDGSAYLDDLKLLEKYGLIQSGTMIVADNVIYPGAPDYLHYIRNNPKYKTRLYESTLEYNDNVRDGVEISVRR
ncbi:unnamed protein product [Rotaria magnacalcarata]|uniref:catechol O-methyltransferase n=1 Tax=Rotaria magnacalcarata TaxID=392030 RepID=A0A816V594_9BILA|nr:unnamed protein product [Rotaria magnacalcarata]CAF1664830.1 unnamed protein product [Rotaria magnacalcarata]CAF2077692.1 unnamed protein product [Rotaria magnacalcarata]CAF2082640.1 unnamed protein product [Rotaria magnacalcarata]CAF2116401.1 unnamed protein product [Rotaria magnacalcarata]